MKKARSSIFIVLFLTLCSVLLYSAQILFFDTPRDTGFYILQDLAFLPVQIAIVTIVLGKYLKDREKSERLEKINLLINAFFSEAGTDILIGLVESNKNIDEVSAMLDIQPSWDDNSFLTAVNFLKSADLHVECSPEQLETLKTLMKAKREFLLRMIENQNVLEHDTFTDMLLATFHVMEELLSRDTFESSNKVDLAHLANDIQRSYRALLIQWVEYMRFLRSDYPYLYSLELRKNPFSKSANVMVSA